MKWKRKKKQEAWKLDKSMQPWFLKLMAFCQCLAIILFNFYAFTVMYLIMMRGRELKYWTVPLLLLHMFFLAFLAGWLQFRKVKREQHMLLGDELYYKEYPLDLWLLERRLAWDASMKLLAHKPRLLRVTLSFGVAVASGRRGRRRYTRRQPTNLAPLNQVLSLFGLLLLCFYPLYWIFLETASLGWGALLLLFLYVGALSAVAWLVDLHRERLLEHMLLGDRDYYARYRFSAWLLEKRLAWARLRRQVGNPTLEIRC